MAGFGKILLVVSNRDYAQLIRSMMLKKDPDCVVVHARDGLEAISIMSDGYRPDMIVADRKLPRMNGHELLLHVKSDNDLRSIPIFLLSGNCSEIELKRSKDLTDWPYFERPRHQRELDLLILRLIRRVPDA